MVLGRQHSIRWWLVSFAAAVSLPLILLLVWMFATQVDREQLAARDAALRIARATSARLSSMHTESQALLDRMAARSGIRDFDATRCDSLFGIVDFFPQYVNLLLFDDHGQVICSAEPESASDRLFSAEGARWIAGELRAGRLVPRRTDIRAIGSQWISTISVPVTASDGKRRGTLALIELPEVAGRQTLPPGSVVTILDRAGTIVVRSDEPGQWAGQSARGSAVAALAMRMQEGRAEAVGLDGISRQYGFTTIPRLGWYIYVGVPTSAVMRPVRALFLRGLAGGAVVVLIVIGVAALLSRSIEKPVNELARAARSVAAGEYGKVTLERGVPVEIATLANSFNEMVESRSRFERDLKSLSERLLVVQEEERTRIARAIHDDLGQLLTALKMDVLGLLSRHEAPPAIRDRIVSTLDATVSAVQRIATELRPSMLDDLGLLAAIESEARLFEERTGIECDVSMPSEAAGLDRVAATAIYRIVQEALTNVVRHSNATRVELRLRQRTDELLLEIRDDGRGLTRDEAENPRSLGLIGIRERAAMIGGSVEFEGVAGRGTIVSVRVPSTALTMHQP